MAEYFTKDGEEFVKVEDQLFTQTEIDTNIMPKRLERERSKYADYDAIKEKASEFEKLIKEKDTKLSDFEKQLNQAKLETDKVKVIHEFKLSDELAEFVTGETPDEMRQRAEKLSKGITGSGIQIKKQGKPDEKQSDSKVIASKLFGGKSDD